MSVQHGSRVWSELLTAGHEGELPFGASGNDRGFDLKAGRVGRR